MLSWRRRLLCAPALAIALAAVPAAPPALASAPAAGGLTVTSDLHHDTSRPLRDLRPSAGRGRTHTVHHAPPGTGPGRSAPDTRGRGAARALIPSPSASFEGAPDNSGVVPPDNDGAAGPTQYVELVNSQLTVFSKSGSILLGPENTNTLWSGFG